MNGPGVGQAVQVIAPSGSSHEALVKDAGRTSFVLRLEGGAREPVQLLRDQHVSIEFTNQRGVCRIVGTASATAGNTALRVDADGTIELIQRRDYVRVEAFVPVTYKPYGPDGATAVGHTLDVSGGGFRLAEAEGLLLGDMNRFTIELGEGEQSLQAVGQAVRESGDREFGMRFVEILERERQRLVRWVFARERLLRQIARHP